VGAEEQFKQQLRKLWLSALPMHLERIRALESALNSLDNLSAAQQEEARSAAHNLAGVLGTFGLQEGTEIARLFEEVFSSNPVQAPAGLQTQLDELRRLIETHHL